MSTLPQNVPCPSCGDAAVVYTERTACHCPDCRVCYNYVQPVGWKKSINIDQMAWLIRTACASSGHEPEVQTT